MEASLTVFLPIHNRGRLTANFIKHLHSIRPAWLRAEFVILDDRSTDSTLAHILAIEEAVVVALDGNAFWGGAINAAKKYVSGQAVIGNTSDYYLLANDDIRYRSKDGFLRGLEAVSKGSVVCARATTVPHADLDTLCIDAARDGVWKGTFYDWRSGRFRDVEGNQAPNVAATYSMLSTVDAWQAASFIPPTIPHYLSDYWLTHDLTDKGFRILHPEGFTCVTSSLTSNNHRRPIEISGLKEIVERLGCYTAKTSPLYIPAWITFWAKGRPSLSRYIKIVARLSLYALALAFALCSRLAARPRRPD